MVGAKTFNDMTKDSNIAKSNNYVWKSNRNVKKSNRNNE